MNAITPATGRPPLERQVLAVQNAGVLRAIGRGEYPTLSQIAEATGKDRSNLSKTLTKLEEAGLIGANPYHLTPDGFDILPRLDVLDGLSEISGGGGVSIPAGFALLTHADIYPDEDNARESSGLSEAEIDELADTIAAKGILQKPIVRQPSAFGRARLVDGYRRWLAWGRLIERGTWTEDHVELCSIQSGDELELTEAALIANAQRSNLNNLEEALAWLRLNERFGRTAPMIAAALGKNERTIQIGLKVARETTHEDRAKYLESERAYRAGETKRTFTWEDLRDTIRTPKHVTELAKSPRMALMVAELAWRALVDEACFSIESRAEFLHVSPPPGAGFYATALDLKLIEANYDDGKVYVRVAELGWSWLESESFHDDPAAYINRVRVAALGEVGAKLADEKGYGTIWIKPPPAPAPKPQEAPAPSSTDTQSTPRDTFSAQIREAIADDAADQTSAQDEAPVEQAAPKPTPPAPTGPVLSAAARLAMLELRHKIAVAPVEARGGAIIAAVVASDYHKDRASHELTVARYIGFMPGPAGKGWIAFVPTQGAEFIASIGYGAGVTDADLALETACLGYTQGEDYVTPWLRAEATAAPPAPAASAPTEQAPETASDEAPFAEDEEAEEAAFTINNPGAESDPETPPMPFHIVVEQGGEPIFIGAWSEDDGRQVIKALAESGHFETITLRDRTGHVCLAMGAE